MALTEFLDKGASLGVDRPCLVGERVSFTYGEAVELSYRVGAALASSGIEPGDRVAILAANDPVAFAAVFGISRAGAIWCPLNPRSEADELQSLLELFGCRALLYQVAFSPLVNQIVGKVTGLRVLVALDGTASADLDATGWTEWTAKGDILRTQGWEAPVAWPPQDDRPVMLVGTGGTTGKPKGVVLPGRALQTMTAITLMAYPWEVGGERPTYLAITPLTHAAGVLCFPVLCRGGRIVIRDHPDPAQILRTIGSEGVTHTFAPPTVIYSLLAQPELADSDLSSLRCFWYGAAPMSPTRLAEALERIGPVMAQLFGQSEAPMMVSTMAPRDHFRADGSVATERLSSAGRPSPLVTVAIMDDRGGQLAAGERGEIVVRSSLVMSGYHDNPQATAEASRWGWHHTGDVGYLDDQGWLYVVDRIKDMIITGGFNVYSAEVEAALMAHPDVHEAAVVGLPDDYWGEVVTAVVEASAGAVPDPQALRLFTRERLGGVKAPKQIQVWETLPRSKLGKVQKPEVRRRLLAHEDPQNNV